VIWRDRVGAGRPVWMERPTPAGLALKGLVLALIVLVMIYPFVAVIMTSLSTEKEIVENGGLVLLPLHPSLDAYRTILHGGIVTRALAVSIGITLIGTLANMVATTTLAYALSRKGVIGARPVLLLVVLSTLIGGGIIPNYLLVRELGMLDTFQSLIVPGLIAGFNLFVLRAFFMSIPQELLDSAKIDGAGEVAILTRVVLPLSKGVLAVISLFYAVAHWNSWFNALLYLNDPTRWPLPLILRLYVIQGSPLPVAGSAVNAEAAPPPQAIQMAVVVVALVPILLVYPFLQRYFTKGVLTGAIKG